MSRDRRLYWDDMQRAADKVRRYAQGMDAVQFRSDEKTRDAVLHNLLVIGEAAKRLPEKIRASARRGLAPDRRLPRHPRPCRFRRR